MGVHEPVATFSACFGLPFMPRHPVEYAKLLGSKLQAHPTTCYLLNTGWTGGGYSSGQRISIAATRTLLNAALNGALAKAPTAVCPIFGLRYVTEVAGVNSTLLSPKQSWNNPAAYDQAALKLKMAFHKNMQQYADAAADVLPAAMLLPQKKGVAA